MQVRAHPVIYEINTWAWLTALSRQYRRPITLASVPAEVYDALAAWGFDAIWLMGVWERSPAARDLARRPQPLDEYRRALPDLQPEDVVGSAYAVHRYVVDAFLGGPDALAQCRAELARRGMALLLDYVPNHVALDHPWLTTNPEAMVHGDAKALAADPVTFFRGPRGDSDVVAHGRDPYFPAWNDTAQVNAFAPAARDLARSTLDELANQCDGVRCDMAMLLLNRVFANLWSAFAGAPPSTEFWIEIIPAIKAAHPNFLFLAEAYWGTEEELQTLGFDYTYEKSFYDELLAGNIEAVKLALARPAALQARMLHFVENHDEERAAVAFGRQRSLTAAAVSMLAPGARLLHEGQLAGWRVKAPVQLGRVMEEATDLEIAPFYRVLLDEARQPIYHVGVFTLVNGPGEGPLVFAWTLRNDWRLVAVNYTDHPAKASVALPGGLSPAPILSAREVFSHASAAPGEERLSEAAFALDLPAFGVQVWRSR
ncbi:MAG TPA: alpha-amylase family glycosyl hydrolase [Ktedonobacterales bacterium]